MHIANLSRHPDLATRKRLSTDMLHIHTPATALHLFMTPLRVETARTLLFGAAISNNHGVPDGTRVAAVRLYPTSVVGAKIKTKCTCQYARSKNNSSSIAIPTNVIRVFRFLLSWSLACYFFYPPHSPPPPRPHSPCLPTRPWLVLNLT